jgi:hypothetical protein
VCHLVTAGFEDFIETDSGVTTRNVLHGSRMIHRSRMPSPGPAQSLLPNDGTVDNIVVPISDIVAKIR